MESVLYSPTLTSSVVTLKALQSQHCEALTLAAQDERIWEFSLDKINNFSAWFDKALTDTDQLSFIVLSTSDNKILGSTRLYHINLKHKHATIGYTWYIPEVWGAQVNSHCKFLLLQYAFEHLNLNRVDFNIDSNNLRSVAAVKKLGAAFEGVLRKHMIRSDGFVRDTCIFSIIHSEWPKVKKNLQNKIAII